MRSLHSLPKQKKTPIQKKKVVSPPKMMVTKRRRVVRRNVKETISIAKAGN